MAAEPEGPGRPGDDPDGVEKPSSPAQLTRPSWSYVLRRSVY